MAHLTSWKYPSIQSPLHRVAWGLYLWTQWRLWQSLSTMYVTCCQSHLCAKDMEMSSLNLHTNFQNTAARAIASEIAFYIQPWTNLLRKEINIHTWLSWQVEVLFFHGIRKTLSCWPLLLRLILVRLFKGLPHRPLGMCIFPLRNNPIHI